MERLRRLRKSAAIRDMVRENHVRIEELIYPVFAMDGEDRVVPVSSMPGVSQYTVDRLPEVLEKISGAGIRAILLFGVPAHKDEVGSAAYDEDGVVPRAIRAIKTKAPELVVIADVCLCEYTSHGHCGLVKDGVILNDETLPLLSKASVAYAKTGCELVYVGKESGHHTMPQDGINALLMRLAVTHRNVVRLKGGDPFVFGRGGEEMAYLARVGIPCRTIPGVTSAIAAAESVLIPVTHRGVASGFEVVTAHAGDGESLTLDFTRMLDERRTYVFLMGLARVAEIAAGLIAAGRSADTPAAVVSAATTPEERCVTGTLADIALQTNKAGLRSPAVLIVGAVVGLRRELGLPLAGGRFLVPVIEGGTTRLAEKVRRLGGDVDEVTVGRIVKIDNALKESDLAGVDRIVLTSRNGWLGLDERMVALAKARGIRIEEVRKVDPIGRTLHLTQPDADRVLGVRSVDVYRNDEVPLQDEIDLSRYDAAFFTCASSVRRICAKSVGSTLALSIGPKTAKALEDAGLRTVTGEAPNLDALLSAAISAWRSGR